VSTEVITSADAWEAAATRLLNLRSLCSELEEILQCADGGHCGDPAWVVRKLEGAEQALALAVAVAARAAGLTGH
jgi:hypothetical protein